MNINTARRILAGKGVLQSLRIIVWWVWLRAVCTPVCSLLGRMKLLSWGAHVGGRLRVRGRLRVYSEGAIRIGDNVRINSGPANFVGADKRMALWGGRGGKLLIEDGCALSNSTIIAAESITIRSGVFLGGGCEVYDTDFHELDPAGRAKGGGEVKTGPVEIGAKAFIGGHSIILKNVTIGAGAIIGAGSVVACTVPAYEIWAGAPAKFIRKLEQAPGEEPKE